MPYYRRAYGIFVDTEVTDWNAPGRWGNVWMTVEMGRSEHAQIKFSSSKQLEQFVNSLRSAVLEFENYRSVAKKVGMSNMSVQMSTRFKDLDVYFTSNGNWGREEGVDVAPHFIVNGHGDCYLWIKTDEMNFNAVVAKSFSLSFAGSAITEMSTGHRLFFTTQTVPLL